MGMDGLSIADAMALAKDGDGGMFGGGNGAWVFFLFFLLAWGNGGLFGGNAAVRPATEADVQRGFDTNTIVNKLDGITNGLCDGFYSQNTSMLQGFNGIQRGLCEGFGSVNAGITTLGYQMKDCCCETNRNIDAVRYEAAQNTCAITNAIHAEGEITRALINANTVQSLRDQLADAKLANSQCAQNAYLINQIKPCPIPAYPVANPYTGVGAYGYCGCGN